MVKQNEKEIVSNPLSASEIVERLGIKVKQITMMGHTWNRINIKLPCDDSVYITQKNSHDEINIHLNNLTVYDADEKRHITVMTDRKVSGIEYEMDGEKHMRYEWDDEVVEDESLF